MPDATDTAQMTLTDFLLARITEDEAVAREARPHEHLRTRDDSPLQWETERLGYARVLATSGRVLAECEAKRRIVGLHRPSRDTPGPEWLPYCEGCWEEGGMDGAPSYPCRTARFLALPYAEHPDYRDEWKP